VFIIAGVYQVTCSECIILTGEQGSMSVELTIHQSHQEFASIKLQGVTLVLLVKVILKTDKRLVISL
jgi:hypothetical protein